MLTQRLQQDQTQALKSGDKLRLNILRFINAQIKNKEIDKKSELSDEETINILRKQIKELKESIDAAQKANRLDLIEENKKQLDIVQTYLPKEISDDELKEEVKKLIEKNQELYNNNPKALMGICIKELKSKAEPSRIIQTLQSTLS